MGNLEPHKRLERDLVSIVVPTKNRASLLPRAIYSLLKQSHQKLEILIVDDNSVDDTFSVVSSFMDLRIRYISSKFTGRSNARNLGIMLARGEFLGFLDDDDAYLPNKIATQISLARNFPEKDIFVGKSNLKDLNDRQLNDFGIQELDQDENYRNFLPGTLMLPSLLFRFSDLQDMKFNSQMNRFEDLDFYSRYLDNSKIHFHSDVVANVYTHPGNSLNESLASKIPGEISRYRGILKISNRFNRQGLSRLSLYYGSALLNTKGFYWQGIILIFKGIWLGPKKISTKNLKFVIGVGKTVLKRLLLRSNLPILNQFRRLKFNVIYKLKLFGKSESRSGPGSDAKETRVLVRILPTLLTNLEISSLADIPCGDFNWMREIDLHGIKYSGFDIVGKLIKSNRRKYPAFDFKQLDITKETFPAHDLVICRDLTVHLTNKQIFSLIHNVKKSESRYLLTTTFPLLQENKELRGEIWRPLNLEIAPFSFGPPLEFLLEESTESPLFPDKGLALWEIKKIHLEWDN